MDEITLPERVAELIAQHGSLRAAARVLNCDAGYLSRLQSGERDDPGGNLLRRMGLRQIVTYERIDGRAAEAEASTTVDVRGPVERCECGWPMPCVKTVPVGFCRWRAPDA